MITRQQLEEILASWPTEPEGGAVSDPPAEGEVSAAEDTEKTAENEPGDTPPGTNQMEPSTVENTEISAPPIPTDITVITPDDMTENSLDMRLAAFYQKQQELENTVKILLGEVKALQGNFETINVAIDTAAKTSPTVETIESLINQL